MIQVHTSDTPEQEAGEHLTKLLKNNSEKPILLLLSGGSGFSVLEHVDTDVFGDNVTVGVLDERCSTDENINNFEQLRSTRFFTNVVENNVATIDTSISNEEMCAVVAKEWEETLMRWFDHAPDGIVIATLGLGEDGHIAGIMPNVSEDFENSYVASYEVSKDINEYTKRITITNRFLREKVDEGVLYVKGEKKEQALESVVSEKGDLRETPGRIIHEMKAVHIFTD